MHSASTRTRYRSRAAGLFAGLLLLALPTFGFAQEPLQRPAADAADIAKQHANAFLLKREAIWQEASVRLHEAREHAALVRRAKLGDKRAIRALKARPASESDGVIAGDLDPRPANEVLAERDRAQRNSPLSALFVPTNVQCNNTSTDGTNAGQSETSIAAIGKNVVVAWNDGQGFYTGSDVQGFGWSNDGGATFTDGGNIVHPPAFAAWKWTSDPVMTVNEKTGDYYYCGLAAPDASTNAIAIARGRFTAGVFAFDSVFIVRTVPNATAFLDKQWIAADSTNGYLYVTNTTFTATDQIDFSRSTDGGRTWSPAVQISNAATDNGNVQGSRPAVGPNGELYVVWYAADATTDEDDLRFRVSLDKGLTFDANNGLLTPVKFNQQFGTGAPAFNRERGVNFPTIAVDRSNGAHRGRVYISWAECYHFLNDALPTVTSAISKFESAETTTGTNDTPATATPFTIGQVLRGSLTTKTVGTTPTRDLDYWSFPMTAGQHIIVYLDSVTASRGFTCRIYAPDGTQRLQYAGKPDSTSGSGTVYYTFTAPASATYFLRLASVTFRSLTYRVRTTFGVSGTERGRDQRDAFVAWSDDGATWLPANVARVNDEGVGYDNWLPELAVANDGMPYASWFDHRDDLYGSRTHMYLSRSADGGASWAANHVITTAQSNFTTSPSNIAPNHGDYQAIGSSGSLLGAAWGDGRSAGPTGVDVWSTAIPTTSDITTVPNDTTMAASGTGAFGWTLANANTVFGGAYKVLWSANRNWPLPANAIVNIAAGSSAFYSASVTVPDTAAAGPVRVCLTLLTPGGAVAKTSCFTINVAAGALAVGTPLSGFALAPAAPNPALDRTRIAFSLPRAGRMTLSVYDLAGARVRTLVDENRPAGQGSVVWDGRDQVGAQVHSGAFFYRLEFAGRTLTRRLVLMR